MTNRVNASGNSKRAISDRTILAVQERIASARHARLTVDRFGEGSVDTLGVVEGASTKRPYETLTKGRAKKLGSGRLA